MRAPGNGPNDLDPSGPETLATKTLGLHYKAYDYVHTIIVVPI
jgi:hypothetical protein